MLKTLLPCWPNLSSNKFCWLVVSLLATGHIFAQNFTGFISDLEKLIKIDRTKLEKKVKLVKKNPKLLTGIKPQNYKIDPDHLRSFFLHTDLNYSRLIQIDECHFFSLLENDLLRSSLSDNKFIMMLIKNKEGSWENAYVPTKNYLQQTYLNKCKDRVSIKNKFLLKNLRRTLKKETNFLYPEDFQSCESIHSYWLRSKDTPYYCSIHNEINSEDLYKGILKSLKKNDPKKSLYTQKIQRISRYKSLVSIDYQDFLKSMCTNLNNKEGYCSKLRQSQFWTKNVNSKDRSHLSQYKCKSLTGRNKLTKSQLTNCALDLDNNDNLCHYLGAKDHSSLTPAPGCADTAEALQFSYLSDSYQDCPGNVDIDAIVNTGRILNHFETQKFDAQAYCATNSTAPFAKLALESDNERSWGIKLCYNNKINQSESCIPTIYGDNITSPYSEGTNISRILFLTKGTDKTLKCGVIPRSKYKPYLLEYKSGCWAIFEDENCHATHCPKTILLNEQVIGHIKYKGQSEFDYFPLSLREKNFAVSSMLENTLKLKRISIDNFTRLKFVLKSKNNSLIHGVGCAEDLLPGHFRRRGINNCNPLSFIIDGFMDEGLKVLDKETKNIVLRTAIDSIHSPRVTHWSKIFESVKNYQNVHPQKKWTLEGVW